MDIIIKTCQCDVHPLHPTSNKTGVYRSIPSFLIFDPKHKLWVQVGTASHRLEWPG